MSLVDRAVEVVERTGLPDPLARAGIALLVERTRRSLRLADASAAARFVRTMTGHPVAPHAEAANAQHYALPPAFFGLILGPRRKYSCCLYDGAETLAAAEERMLAETAGAAGLSDGQRILELGCGWGSLSLWLAERQPASRITAVSNSAPQRAHIEAEAARRGLGNLRVITADMNAFDIGQTFDRVVSIEMFEHISNWPVLLGRIRRWLEPRGRLFLHVFSHRSVPYRFDHAGGADWIGQHFFTGGIMPSHDLIDLVPAPFEVEFTRRWNGTHYRRTAEDWLANFDREAAAIQPILQAVYGGDALLWRRRWRYFFLATAGLFGARGGDEWGVSHYRLRPI